MSYNGSGVFNINTSGQPVVTGTVISSTAFNALTADLATGLTTALTKDGQTTPTANIPMGGYKITGIAAATTLGDALSYGRAATVSTLTNSALTSGRVPYASTAGLLVDSANLLYSGTDLTVYGLTVGRGGGGVSTNTVLGISALQANTTGLRTVAIGQNSLYTNTTGNSNVSIGYNAMQLNLNGQSNVAIGSNYNYNAPLQSNTSGSFNAAVGEGALGANTTGSYNAAMGVISLQANTTASNNTAVGYGAMSANTSGGSNIAIGFQTLQANTTASNNTAVGYQALLSNTTPTDQVAVGSGALRSNTTGALNSALGSGALYTNTTGGSNSAFGRLALFNNTTADNNSAFGYYALAANTTGGNNTAMGKDALVSNTTASNNTAMGYQAGYSATTGGNNVFIGSGAGYTTTPTTTGSGNVYIGYQTYGSAAGNQREIAIGYNVAGQGANIVTLGSDLGKIYCSYTVNATWTQTSDGRMKKDIKDDSLGLSFINRLRPRTFTWKPNNELDPSNPYYAEENKRDTTTVVHGLVAQEVKEALDAEGVDTFAGWVEGIDGVQAISREMYISPLIKAIQELTARLTALESK